MKREASLAALDWGELCARLAGAAESAGGRALGLAPPFAADVDEARRRMAAVAELAALVRADEKLPSLAAPEIAAAVASAEKAIVLGADELRPIAVVCDLAAAAARRFGELRGRAPEIAALAADLNPPLGPPSGLARAVADTFDAAGEIRDDASEDLGRLRAERRALEEHARGAIESLMRDEEYASVMQDQYFTIRAERYVLPLKASAKSLGLGIVHDTSRTGETVFVEPTALVAANNRLKIVELEIRRESRRILEALTAEVSDAAGALRRTATTLAALDARLAAARLGVEYGGQAVEIVEAPVIDLVAGRHPLLALAAAGRSAGGAVVANDVAVGGPGRPAVLVVSGPNAGGKTVLMKTVGMAALLARAGLLVPADGRSRIGFFDDVLVDIGDRQSVLGDLSTFSAHLSNVGEILSAAASAAAPALVLLDELMAGTNPEQGAALARATAEALVEHPVVAIVTTHYDSLKALGESDARFANAGMEYDLARLRPTFRLAVGAPGRSYAFDIAARLGLPAPLLARARDLAGNSSLGLEAVIARLETREAELAEAREALAATRAEAAAAAAASATAAADLERRERELARHVGAAIDAELAGAREEMRVIIRRAQGAGTSRAAEAGRAELERVAGEARARLPADETSAEGAGTPAATAPRPAPLAAGARVFVARLGAEGILAQPPDARGRAKVTVGAMTIEVDADELVPAKGGSKGGGKPAPGGGGRGAGKAGFTAGAGIPAAENDDLALVSQSNTRTIDLRGQSGDEALTVVESGLDRAALAGESHVIVVHGHGTGALRKRVRAYLDDSPYVARWTAGTGRQGGDGVSIVALR